MRVIRENYDHHHRSILDQTIWIYVDSDSMMIYYDRFYDRSMMIYVECSFLITVLSQDLPE